MRAAFRKPDIWCTVRGGVAEERTEKGGSDGIDAGLEARLAEAEATAARGDLRGAMDLLDEHFPLDRGTEHHFVDYRLRAELLYRMEYFGDLKDLFYAWRDFTYDRQYVFLAKARLAFANGDYERARKRANALLVLEKELPGAFELRGDLLAEEGKLRAAVRYYSKELGVDGANAYAHAKRADALLKSGRPGLAVRACKAGLKVRPRSRKLRKTLALARREAEQK